MNTIPTPAKAHSHRGFSMIEMLVGVLIISFGLLGLMALQSRALQVSVGTEDSQRAALLASELAATMVNQGTVNLDAPVVQGWAARVADPASGGLPSGVGTVTVANSVARVSIQWTPPQSASGAANGVHKYQTDVVVP